MQKQQVVSAEQRFLDRQELEIIDAAAKGDRRAFRQLYEAHCGRVYALCLRITADRAMAEDATQEVFVQVWRKIGEFRAESRFSTWLHTVAVNATLGYLRRQKGWASRMTGLKQEEWPEEAVREDANQLDLDRYIARLPERARIVFVLRAVEGYRHEEIAEKLNMAVGTSKSQFSRARSLLQEWIEA